MSSPYGVNHPDDTSTGRRVGCLESVPMGLRPAKPHEKQPRVAQTCRSLACLRLYPKGAYIPPKYGGTYAPPWFFDPAPLSRKCIIPPKYGGTYAPPWFFDPAPLSRRRIHPAKARRDVCATPGFSTQRRPRGSPLKSGRSAADSSELANKFSHLSNIEQTLSPPGRRIRTVDRG
jgi:hypothetical protein